MLELLRINTDKVRRFVDVAKSAEEQAADTKTRQDELEQAIAGGLGISVRK